MYKSSHRLMDEADASGTAGGAAGTVTPPAATIPPVGTPPVVAPAAQVLAEVKPAEAKWYEGFADPALKEWASAAGLPSAEHAASKAWNLEKLMGADRAGRTLTLPTDLNDMKSLAPIYDKLGRPADPTGYKIPVPDGADPAFSKEVSGWFHETGLNQAQAQSLSEKWNQHIASVNQQVQQQEAETLRQEHAKLATEWGTGPAAQAQKELAKRGAVKLGLDDAAITALEKVSGFSGVLKALAKVGEMTSEGDAAGFGENEDSFSMTPATAQAQKSRLMADPEWRKKYLNGDHQARNEMTKINQVLAANQA